MSNISIIIGREFNERVRKKSFMKKRNCKTA